MNALRLVLLSSLLLLPACNMATVPETPPAPKIETVVVVVTATPTNEATPSPTETETETPPPLCEVDPETICALPEAEVRDKFCTNKVPYILMVFPKGTSFDVEDERFTCTDEGIRGGEQMVSCYGPELYSFDLKVCNAVCVPSGAVLEQGACADGFGFDSTNECCMRLPSTDTNCRIIQVDLGACP